jgi:hypothetical protein
MFLELRKLAHRGACGGDCLYVNTWDTAFKSCHSVAIRRYFAQTETFKLEISRQNRVKKLASRIALETEQLSCEMQTP